MKRLAHEAGITQPPIDSDEESKQPAASIEPSKRVNMPKKSQHRMHAHINPFAPLNMPTPKNPRFVDWALHYPSYYGSKDNNKNRIVVNSKTYPISYDGGEA